MTAPDPSIELMRLINGYQVSQALHVAATLGVADQLKDGPKSYDTVAQPKVALSIAACSGCGRCIPREWQQGILAHSIRCLLD